MSSGSERGTHHSLVMCILYGKNVVILYFGSGSDGKESGELEQTEECVPATCLPCGGMNIHVHQQ